MYTIYISKNSSILWLLTSKDEDFLNYWEVLLLMKRSNIDIDAQKVLGDLDENMWAAKLNDTTVFISLIEEINKNVIKYLETYKKTIGNEKKDYICALTNY